MRFDPIPIHRATRARPAAGVRRAVIGLALLLVGMLLGQGLRLLPAPAAHADLDTVLAPLALLDLHDRLLERPDSRPLRAQVAGMAGAQLAALAAADPDADRRLALATGYRRLAAAQADPQQAHLGDPLAARAALAAARAQLAARPARRQGEAAARQALAEIGLLDAALALHDGRGSTRAGVLLDEVDALLGDDAVRSVPAAERALLRARLGLGRAELALAEGAPAPALAGADAVLEGLDTQFGPTAHRPDVLALRLRGEALAGRALGGLRQASAAALRFAAAASAAERLRRATPGSVRWQRAGVLARLNAGGAWADARRPDLALHALDAAEQALVPLLAQAPREPALLRLQAALAERRALVLLAAHRPADALSAGLAGVDAVAALLDAAPGDVRAPAALAAAYLTLARLARAAGDDLAACAWRERARSADAAQPGLADGAWPACATAG